LQAGVQNCTVNTSAASNVASTLLRFPIRATKFRAYLACFSRSDAGQTNVRRNDRYSVQT